MSEELIKQIEKAVSTTGYPLELEVGALLEQKGWFPFHSVEYQDPFTKKTRELDLLAYKLVNNRRIELRISCKSSANKQFVFFTRKKNSTIWLNDIKITPVSDNWDDNATIPVPLIKLPFFNYERETVNYTVVTDPKN